MDLSEILNMLSVVPTWVWIVGGIIFIFFVFGEKILWDYEVKFPYKDGIGRGEVDLECGAKKGARIECVFEMEPVYQNISLDIILDRNKIFTVPAEKNNSDRFRIQESISLFEEPSEGDLVEVEAKGKTIFSGPLVLD